MKKEVRILVLAAVLLCFVCLPVRADLITIAISGQITSVSDPCSHFENKIHVGDTITGTYIYDSTMLDLNPSPTLGDYVFSASPAGMWLSIEGFNFETDPNQVSFHIGVYKDTLEDQLVIASNQNLSLPNGTPVQYIIWQLTDSTGTALSNDALPLTAPDLSRWDSSIYANQLAIFRDRDFAIVATVTSAVLVPEPATLLLLAFGIAILKCR